MPRRRKGRGRRGGSNTIYHVAVVQASADAKVSAGGLNFWGDRPVLVRRARVSFAHQGAPTTGGTIPATSVSFGIYSPIHAEAVSWSRTRLLTALPVAISLRTPKGQDHGHYLGSDAVIICTIKGIEAGYKILIEAEVWVTYGPPTAPAKFEFDHIPPSIPLWHPRNQNNQEFQSYSTHCGPQKAPRGEQSTQGHPLRCNMSVCESTLPRSVSSPTLSALDYFEIP